MLRRVGGTVGIGQQFLQVIAGFFRIGDTEAGGDLKVKTRGFGIYRLDFLAALLGQYSCRVEITARQQDTEFLAAEAGENIVFTSYAPADLYRALKCPVAAGMAVLVVNQLKKVQVKDDDAEFLTGVLAIGQGALCDMAKVPTVKDTRQDIKFRQLL